MEREREWKREERQGVVVNLWANEKLYGPMRNKGCGYKKEKEGPGHMQSIPFYGEVKASLPTIESDSSMALSLLSPHL